jgi:hypothetical protein
MWIMTTRGFYSAVQKRGDADEGMVTIRARVKADLERLGDLLPDAKPYRQRGYSDYPWRVRVTAEEWAAAVKAMALEIDYSNFKNEVKRVQGGKRAQVYSRVWGVLLSLQPSRRYSGRRRYRFDEPETFPEEWLDGRR